MSATIIRISPYNRLANQMMQLMFARTVQRLARAPVAIEGYDLPEWQLSKPASLPASKSVFPIGDGVTRASTIASAIDRYRPKQIDLVHHVARVGNLLPKIAYDDLFPLRNEDGISVGKDSLLIHIRAGDVAAYAHPLYGPLPIAYYRYLVDSTGLQPVFIGEIETSPHCDLLRSAFPNAVILSGGSAHHDFQTIRRAHHIALGVGTFSWLASYLSDAQTIHLPIAGIFDPREAPDIDLLPTSDRRFRFHDIPTAVWKNRYSDFCADSAAFRPLSSWEVEMRRMAAMVRSAYRLGRVRFGMERRLLRNALGNATSRLTSLRS